MISASDPAFLFLLGFLGGLAGFVLLFVIVTAFSNEIDDAVQFIRRILKW